jgi:hypothetical protein
MEQVVLALAHLSDAASSRIASSAECSSASDALHTASFSSPLLIALAKCTKPPTSSVQPGAEDVLLSDPSLLSTCAAIASDTACIFRALAHALSSSDTLTDRLASNSTNSASCALVLCACAHAAGTLSSHSHPPTSSLFPWRSDDSAGAALALIDTFAHNASNHTNGLSNLISRIGREAHSKLSTCSTHAGTASELDRIDAVLAAEAVRCLLRTANVHAQHDGMDVALRPCMPCLLLGLDHESPLVKRSAFDALGLSAQLATRSELRAHASVAVDALCRRVHGCEGINWSSVCRAMWIFPTRADHASHKGTLVSQAASELVTEGSRRKITSENGRPLLQALQHLVRNLGLRSLKLLATLVPLALSYVGETSDSDCQVEALKLLCVVSEVTWPRAPSNAPHLQRLLWLEIQKHEKSLAKEVRSELNKLLDTLTRTAGEEAISSTEASHAELRERVVAG